MQGPRFNRQQSTVHRLNEVAAERAFARGDTYAAHRPLSVFLQVASGCNIECYMCIEQLRPPRARRGRDLQSLPREVFDKLCAQVFPYSSTLHIGFGGEPSLSPDFLYFIERGFEHGQCVKLTTNGTRLDQPGVAATIARCVSEMQVSMDGATKETYERIRVGSSWARMQANLKLFNEHRLAYPAAERARLSLWFVLMKSNLHELVAFIEMAARLQAESVHAHHVILTTEAGKPEPLLDEPERYNAVRLEAIQRARELGIELELPKPYPIAAPAVMESRPAAVPAAPLTACADSAPAPTRTPPIACKLPTQFLFMNYEGRVFPCCHPYADVKMRAGDMRTEDFDTIWNNAHFRNLRHALQTGEDMPAICRNCSIAQDPPPAREDPEMIRVGPTLEEWSAGRTAPDNAQRDEPLLAGLKRAGILEQVEVIARERADFVQHAHNLERERPGFQDHIQNLESERAALRAHADGLEDQRRWMLQRIAKLERRDFIGWVARRFRPR